MSATPAEIQKLNTAIDVIEANPSLAHTSAQLARLADISSLRLKQIFQQHTGRTIQQFLTTAKMKKAASLLQQQNITIKEISISLGYSDLTSFYRSFTKHYKCTPVQYRNKYL